VSKERITSVANQYFTNLWGVGGSQGRGAPSIEYRDRQKAKEQCVKIFVEKYDTVTAPSGEGQAVRKQMTVQVEQWWNSSDVAASLREENAWGADGTVAVVGKRKKCVAAGGSAAPTETVEHDDQTLLLDDCAHAEAETVKYGYKDPSIDLLRRAYFHIWGKSGQHIGWRSFAQHKEKCIAADINPLPERTFYRWRSEEENAFKRSEEFDASLHFLSRPIRHQSQISGFRNQLGADRTYVRDTMVDKEPVLRTKNGRSFAFSPDWYPDLVKMCNASLDMLGFGPEMVLALATDINTTTMLIDDKDAPC
jgi:hypothetical protein